MKLEHAKRSQFLAGNLPSLISNFYFVFSVICAGLHHAYGFRPLGLDSTTVAPTANSISTDNHTLNMMSSVSAGNTATFSAETGTTWPPSVTENTGSTRNNVRANDPTQTGTSSAVGLVTTGSHGGNGNPGPTGSSVQGGSGVKASSVAGQGNDGTSGTTGGKGGNSIEKQYATTSGIYNANDGSQNTESGNHATAGTTATITGTTATGMKSETTTTTGMKSGANGGAGGAPVTAGNGGGGGSGVVTAGNGGGGGGGVTAGNGGGGSGSGSGSAKNSSVSGGAGGTGLTTSKAIVNGSAIGNTLAPVGSGNGTLRWSNTTNQYNRTTGTTPYDNRTRCFSCQGTNCFDATSSLKSALQTTCRTSYDTCYLMLDFESSPIMPIFQCRPFSAQNKGKCDQKFIQAASYCEFCCFGEMCNRNLNNITAFGLECIGYNNRATGRDPGVLHLLVIIITAIMLQPVAN